MNKEAQQAVFEYSEIFCNRERLRFANGYLVLVGYEEQKIAV